MEIALVDSCGGQFGATHGSVRVYDVPQSVWEDQEPYTLTPAETIATMETLVENGEANLLREIDVDDTVVV